MRRIYWRLYVWWHRSFDDRWPGWRVCPRHADCFCPPPWEKGAVA